VELIEISLSAKNFVRYTREKSKKTTQTVKIKTSNRTYSSSGGSVVMPQLKEKIHTTEKRVKMFKF
jgi:hypothetical protein